MMIYRTFDGMCWPAPGQEMNDLEYMLRYSQINIIPREKRLVLASIIAAYKELIFKDAVSRTAIIAQLKKGPTISVPPAAEEPEG